MECVIVKIAHFADGRLLDSHQMSKRKDWHIVACVGGGQSLVNSYSTVGFEPYSKMVSLLYHQGEP